MAKTLERFSITRAADDYLITIEDENGDTIEMTATFDQLDMINDELDRAMEEDDIAALGQDDDEDDADTDDE